jgi:hypothetical protein
MGKRKGKRTVEGRHCELLVVGNLVIA